MIVMAQHAHPFARICPHCGSVGTSDGTKRKGERIKKRGYKCSAAACRKRWIVEFRVIDVIVSKLFRSK